MYKVKSDTEIDHNDWQREKPMRHLKITQINNKFMLSFETVVISWLKKKKK